MRLPPRWAFVAIPVLIFVAGVAAYLYTSQRPESSVPQTPEIEQEVQEEVEVVSEEDHGEAVVLSEQSPKNVRVQDGMVYIEREGLTFAIPQGYVVTDISGIDSESPVTVAIDLERAGKKITVHVNWPGEFYGDVEKLELSIDREPKVAYIRQSINYNAAGPYDVAWGNIRAVTDTSHYLSVLFRGYDTSDKRLLESLIDSFQYTQ